VSQDEQIFTMAAHWVQIERPEQALETLGGLSGDAAVSVRAAILRGAALHALERYDEAVNVLRDGIGRHGPAVPLLDLLGRSLGELGRLGEAEAAFLDALRVQPAEPGLLCGYARICVLAGQSDKASALVERAASYAPEDPLIVRMRAQVAFARGKDRAMLRYGREAMAIDPQDQAAQVLYGSASMLTGDPTSGRRLLGAAAASRPGDPELLEAAREAKLAAHPLMWPLRPLARFNPLVVWAAAVAVIFVLQGAGLSRLAGVAVVVWLVFCAYSWIAPPLLRRWLGRR
jgi:predicted Zn-dependent protease